MLTFAACAMKRKKSARSMSLASTEMSCADARNAARVRVEIVINHLFWLRGYCRTHRFKNFLIAWKSDPAFGGHHFVIHPDGKLPRLSSNGVDFNPEFFLQQRRYTSSARWVGRSD